MDFTSAKLWHEGVELTCEAAGSCELTEGGPACCTGTLTVPKKEHAWFKAVNGVESQNATFILYLNDAVIVEIARDDAGPPVDVGEAGRFRFTGIRRLDSQEYARQCGGAGSSGG